MSKLLAKYDTVTGKEHYEKVKRDEVESDVADRNYVHDQGTASALWTVTHNLGKYPSVTVIDSGGTVVFGQVTHLTINELTVNFCYAFSGKAILN